MAPTVVAGDRNHVPLQRRISSVSSLRKIHLGIATIGVALVWFSQVSVGGGFGVDVLGPSILAGAGLGLAMVPDTVAAMTGVHPEEAGLASGLINASTQVGGALGLAVLATIANSRTDDVLAGAGGDPAALPGALTEALQSAFPGGAILAVLGSC